MDISRYPINHRIRLIVLACCLALLLLLENVLSRVALVLAWLMFIGAAV